MPPLRQLAATFPPCTANHVGAGRRSVLATSRKAEYCSCQQRVQQAGRHDRPRAETRQHLAAVQTAPADTRPSRVNNARQSVQAAAACTGPSPGGPEKTCRTVCDQHDSDNLSTVGASPSPNLSSPSLIFFPSVAASARLGSAQLGT